MKLDQPLTFPAAAREIEWRADRNGSYKPAGRRLLRLVLRREREEGRKIAIRDGSGRPFQVTLGALTRFLPELCPSKVETLAATLRPLLEEVERRARKIVGDEIEDRVDPELQRLHNRDEEIASEIEHLARLVASAVQPSKPPSNPPPRETARNRAAPKRAVALTASESGRQTRS